MKKNYQATKNVNDFLFLPGRTCQMMTILLFLFFAAFPGQSRAAKTTEMNCHTLDFAYSNYNKGLISVIQTPQGSISVTGKKRNSDGSIAPGNFAALFDTQSPSGDDTDLYTTDWGMALIINQDQTDVPNDNQWGGELILDFSAFGPVTMTSLKALDIDEYEDWSWVYLYDGNGNELHKVQLQTYGNNSKQTVDLGNTKGVMWMKIQLDGTGENFVGSGAIDDIRFCLEDTGSEPCATMPIGSAGPDQVLACRNSVQLEGTSAGDYQYQWTTRDGGLILGENTLRPVVDAAGTYTLRITDPVTQCYIEDVVVVTREEIIVDANAGPDKTLTCERTTVQLEGSSSTEGATYQWTAAYGGHIVSGGNTLNPTVDAAGTYTLIVTGRGRCFTMDKVVVTQDTSLPAVHVEASSLILSCYEGESVDISVSTDVAEATFSWTGPNGFTSTDQRFTVTGGASLPSVGGIYTVTVTDPETGCQASASISINDITRDYTATAGPDKVLSCENPTVRLEGSYDGGYDGDGETQVTWVASDGGHISPTDGRRLDPLVDAPGTYTLTVTNHSTGCTYTDVVVVTGDTTCEGTNATIARIENLKAFPNPMQRNGTIEFRQREAGPYTVSLIDQKGNLIGELQAGTAKAGEKVQVKIDGSRLQKGLYFARIVSGSSSKTIKLILTK